MLTLADFDSDMVLALNNDNKDLRICRTYLETFISIPEEEPHETLQPEIEFQLAKCLVVGILCGNDGVINLIYRIAKIDAGKDYPGLGIPFHYACLGKERSSCIVSLLTYNDVAVVSIPIPQRSGMNALEVALIDKKHKLVVMYLYEDILSVLSEISHTQFFDLVKKLRAEITEEGEQQFLDILKNSEEVESQIQPFFAMLIQVPQPELIIEVANYVIDVGAGNIEELPQNLAKKMDAQLIEHLIELIEFIKEKGSLVLPSFSYVIDYASYIKKKATDTRDRTFIAHEKFISNLYTWKVTKSSGCLYFETEGEIVIGSGNFTNTSQLQIRGISIHHERQFISLSRSKNCCDNFGYDEPFFHPNMTPYIDGDTFFAYNEQSFLYIVNIIEKKSKAIALILQVDWAITHHKMTDLIDYFNQILISIDQLVYHPDDQKLLLSYLLQVKHLIPEPEKEGLDKVIEKLSPTLKYLSAACYLKHNLFNKNDLCHLPSELQNALENCSNALKR